MTQKRGFILGKFMPPHAGHLRLCRAAQAMVEELTILVCSLPDDAMPGEQRARWMRELFPAAHVLHLCRDVPQYPQDSPDFWPVWRTIVREFHPEPIDFVFAGEDYGLELAEQVGGRFVPLMRGEGGDLAQLSGSAVRADPAQHWPHLPVPVRREWVKVVSLHGVESVGKSTLAAQLAGALDTDWVGEYGRWHCEAHGTDLVPADLELIAAAQQGLIAGSREWSGPVLVTDTDWVMTAAWSEMLFGQALGGPDYPLADLYLHLPPDLPWVNDGTRFIGEDTERARFDAICRAQLEKRGARVVTLDAPPNQRLEQALAAILDL